MTLLQFLRDYKQLMAPSSVLLLRIGKEYPMHGIARLMHLIKTNVQMPLESIDIDQLDGVTIIAKLETSFLGNPVIYWLRNCAQADEKKWRQLSTYVGSYKGPNCIVMAVATERAINEGTLVELPDTLPTGMVEQLFPLLFATTRSQQAALTLKRILANFDTVSLDQAVVCMHYALLLGSQHQQFVDEWLDQLIAPTQSLFTLSQHFFAKSPRKFFTYWSTIADEYAEPFWITFWADQLWRAYHFVEFMHKKKFVDAKSMAYRLPFSFQQVDWKKTTPAELQQAHAFLYSFDYAIKNGATSYGLDLFYEKFLMKEFGQ